MRGLFVHHIYIVYTDIRQEEELLMNIVEVDLLR